MLFKAFDSLPGIWATEAISVPREVFRQAVEVNHSGEPGIRTFILLHPQNEVALQLVVAGNASPKNARPLSSRCEPVDVDEHPLCSEFRPEHIAHKRLFRLAFHNRVETNHRDGLPPRTFFSHNSDTVYCSRHSESSSVLAPPCSAT